jgi:organic hydroperoxide reductase OsmC/OhrA
MAEHTALIAWARGEQPFVDGKFSRSHRWTFDGGAVVAASSSPHVVPEPQSVAAYVDPEEAFVAALASCHMLFFLVLAAKRGFVVESYLDEAVGVMAKNEAGRLAMTRVTLRPAVRWGGEKRPGAAEIEALHRQSHERCFIANSVKSEIVVMPRE